MTHAKYDQTKMRDLPSAQLKDAAAPASFDWPLANEAETFLRGFIEDFLKGNSFAEHLAERMLQETGTDFFEWIDHLRMPGHREKNLQRMGFVSDRRLETPAGGIA